MRYDKLVRDKIPEIIRLKGGSAATHIATETEYWNKLKDKLHEEIAEFEASESAEEIADILEVLDAIMDYKGFERSELMELQSKKRAERGAFKERIILEES